MNEFINLTIHHLHDHIVFSTGILLLLGFLLGKLSIYLKIPEITGYIITGLILGPSVLGVISFEATESFRIVTEVALGFIAISIGLEFTIEKMKKYGYFILLIVVIQVLSTFILVCAGLYLFNFSFPLSMILGAIATATAPAATIQIVHRLKAKGEFIDYLYGVVAFDDAACIILYGLVSAIAVNFISINSSISVFSSLTAAFTEVFFSITLGLLMALILHLLTKNIDEDSYLLNLSLGVIFISVSLSNSMHLSSLLTNMSMGFLLVNISNQAHHIENVLNHITEPIIVLFFTIAGTEMNIAVFLKSEILTLGAVFIIFRALGKYGGCYAGSLICGLKKEYRNNLGFCMLPQAGVAIGLILMIQTNPEIIKVVKHNKEFSEMISMMVNIVLMSVFVNELTGPYFSQYGVKKGCNL